MKKNIFTKDNLMFFIILNLGLIFTAVGIAIFKTPNISHLVVHLVCLLSFLPYFRSGM